MRATFSLTSNDYRLLERAIAVRLENTQGRFNLAFFVQVFAWMFITLAVFTYFKQWDRTPDDAQPYGGILLFAVLGFVFAALRPIASQRLYWKYISTSNASFIKEQAVEVQGTSLLLESPVARSVVPRSAVIDHSQDGHNHYLFLSGVQAIIIPKKVANLLGADFASFLAATTSEA